MDVATKSNPALEPAGSQRYSCPLCQTEIDPARASCSPSCPMAKGCSVLCCPSCGYSFPQPTGLSAWLAKFFASRKSGAAARGAGRFLSDVSAGQRVRVTGVSVDGGERLSKLAAFGIVEGCELFVRQRVPALVVEVGETTLALDSEVARAVLVASPD